jgi:hypothetical protein
LNLENIGKRNTKMTKIDFKDDVDKDTIENIETDLRYGLRTQWTKIKFHSIIIDEDDLNLKQIKYIVQIIETYLKPDKVESIRINSIE